MEVGGVHHDGLICSVCSSESINHLSFGAVFDRNFPHSVLPAATESCFWVWITRGHWISDYTPPLSCHHYYLSQNRDKAARKQTKNSTSPSHRMKA